MFACGDSNREPSRLRASTFVVCATKLTWSTYFAVLFNGVFWLAESGKVCLLLTETYHKVKKTSWTLEIGPFTLSSGLPSLVQCPDFMIQQLCSIGYPNTKDLHF